MCKCTAPTPAMPTSPNGARFPTGKDGSTSGGKSAGRRVDCFSRGYTVQATLAQDPQSLIGVSALVTACLVGWLLSEGTCRYSPRCLGSDGLHDAVAVPLGSSLQPGCPGSGFLVSCASCLELILRLHRPDHLPHPVLSTIPSARSRTLIITKKRSAAQGAPGRTASKTPPPSTSATSQRKGQAGKWMPPNAHHANARIV